MVILTLELEHCFPPQPTAPYLFSFFDEVILRVGSIDEVVPNPNTLLISLFSSSYHVSQLLCSPTEVKMEHTLVQSK